MATRILVIDDEPKWIKFAQCDLGSKFEVDVATDLETVIRKLKHNRYDLIVASARYEAILKLMSEQYPHKPVIVATGQPTSGEAIKMYRLGVLDYFVKDFRPDIVSDKILEAVEKTFSLGGPVLNAA